MFIGFKVHTRAVPVVVSKALRAAPARRLAWNVYVTLAAPTTAVSCMFMAYNFIQQIVAVRNSECKKYEKITDS